MDEIPYDQFFDYVGLTLTQRQVEQVYAGFAASRAPGKPLTIVRVDENSAASRLNLSPGDVILEVNGKAFSGDWNQFLQKHNPKSSLHLKVSSAAGEIRGSGFAAQHCARSTNINLKICREYRRRLGARRTAFLRGEAEAGAQ